MNDRSALPSAAARVDALDGLRGIAILAVVLMHCAMFGMVRPDIRDHWLTRTLQLGWTGVDLFFVLSGFLITGILLRTKESPHRFRNFYARRALRIFPLYYVVITLLLFVLPRESVTTAAEKVPYYLYVQNFAWLWPGEAHRDIARDITWSLAVEEQFYLVWPAVVWFASRRGLLRVCVAMIAVAIALRFVLLGNGVSVYFLTPCRFDTLAVGACLALLPPPPASFARLLVALGAAGLGVTAWLSGSSLPEHNVAIQRWGILAALPLAAGLLVLARGNGHFARLCENRVLRSFGRYSYCIYLVHLLVVEQVIGLWIRYAQANPGALDPVPAPVVVLLFTAMCLPPVWLVGFLSWHLFEKHLLALKRHFES